jgi:DNA segregation ATPase FtsK/SpoIIIE, S-DNA-T family
VHLGRDEYGQHVHVNLAERNILLGGESGAGKSSGLNLITAHGALSHDCRLILVDGKQVGLGLWRACADGFIGPSLKDAIDAFEASRPMSSSRSWPSPSQDPGPPRRVWRPLCLRTAC